MKRTTKAGLALALGGSLAGSLAFATIAFAGPAQQGPSASPSPAVATPAVAPASLVKDLTLMREEERLARDVYAALADAYGGAAPMANITNAEQRHYDAIGVLLTRYGIADPAAGKASGSYAVAEIQTMYDALLVQGKKSLADAYDVGIAIEKADIADLSDAIARTDQADAKRVFENLLNGSENHLAAFEAAKAGKTVGVHDGTGLQNGRQGARAQARQGQLQGGLAQGGMGGQGQGRRMGSGNPADCPNG